jgi:hypothetical protein
VQNEPTADNSAASVGPADTSSASAAPPDPAEMAKLAKFADLLSRCRPREDDQDDPEYDM